MLGRRKRSADDFAEEIRAHLALESDELQAEGMSRREAERKARAAFGSATLAQERFRLRDRAVWLETLFQDVRYGLRALRQSPGFTIAAVLTLALGMGANTAIFSLIDTVLLRSLPVHDPSQLFFLKYEGARGIGIAPPYPCFEWIRAQAKSFDGVAAFAGGPSDLKVRLNGSIEHAFGTRVSGDYYHVLGVSAAAGRLLAPEDQQLDPAVAVISYDYWQRRFAGSTDAIGSSFVLDGRRFSIVGVTARGFKGLLPGSESDFTLPMTTMLLGPHDGAGMLVDTGSPWFDIVARLKPGVSQEQARAEVDTIFQAYMTQYPQSPEARREQFHDMVLVSASHGLDGLRKQYSRPLLALMTVVGLVLLIACANITNLLLARAAKREREFAVRIALGAGRGRLFRQLLTETALLFGAGVVAGSLLASFAVKALVSFFAHGARPIVLDVQLDWRMVSFTVAMSLLATLVFGTAPMRRAMRVNPHGALKDGVNASTSRSGIDMGRALVVFQVALSLVLLVGAGLFLRTLGNLHATNMGFQADKIVLASVQLLETSYSEEAARIAVWDRVLKSMRSLPGVQSAALSMMTPLDGSGRRVGFHVPGFQPRTDDDTYLNMNTVSEDYFATLGTPLMRGRSFTANDNAGAVYVAMLNATAVKRFFAGRDPIGMQVHVNDSAYNIIGVVEDVREDGVREEAKAFVYLPMRQPYDRNFRMTLSVRTAADPNSLIASIEKQVRAAGPDILVMHTGTMDAQLDNSIVQERLISTLAAVFGALALVLSGVGLYGVLAYSVVRRTREIGIRLALGELPGQVIQKMLRESMRLVALGLGIGIPASMLMAHAVDDLLYGIAPTDPRTQIVAGAVLAVVGLIASWIPALRASRIQPLIALRCE